VPTLQVDGRTIAVIGHATVVPRLMPHCCSTLSTVAPLEPGIEAAQSGRILVLARPVRMQKVWCPTTRHRMTRKAVAASHTLERGTVNRKLRILPDNPAHKRSSFGEARWPSLTTMEI
jgi:hypothetical protein